MSQVLRWSKTQQLILDARGGRRRFTIEIPLRARKRTVFLSTEEKKNLGIKFRYVHDQKICFTSTHLVGRIHTVFCKLFGIWNSAEGFLGREGLNTPRVSSWISQKWDNSRCKSSPFSDIWLLLVRNPSYCCLLRFSFFPHLVSQQKTLPAL